MLKEASEFATKRLKPTAGCDCPPCEAPPLTSGKGGHRSAGQGRGGPSPFLPPAHTNKGTVAIVIRATMASPWQHPQGTRTHGRSTPKFPCCLFVSSKRKDPAAFEHFFSAHDKVAFERCRRAEAVVTTTVAVARCLKFHSRSPQTLFLPRAHHLRPASTALSGSQMVDDSSFRCDGMAEDAGRAGPGGAGPIPRPWSAHKPVGDSKRKGHPLPAGRLWDCRDPIATRSATQSTGLMAS